MISSGFTNAPVSQFLVFSAVICALIATITDTRYYLHIAVVPHIWTYSQFWRFFTWQVSYDSFMVEEETCKCGRSWQVKSQYSEADRSLDMLHKLD
jgi:hypothetical protein